MAFTVDDAHHGRGIATVLLEHLAAVGRELGITRFTAEVLPDNRPMLGVFRGRRLRGHAPGSRRASSTSPSTSTRRCTCIESVERREQRAESRSIARLVRPRSVAVIGASDRVGSVGRAVFRNLLAGGFDGPVYPVNPTTPHVASVPGVRRGHSTSPTTCTSPSSPCRPPRCDAVVRQCAEKRVRGVVVIATGFADAGPEGAAAERDLVELRPRPRHAPDRSGQHGHHRRPATAARCWRRSPRLGCAPGRVGVSLQSGPLGIGLLELADRLGVGISSFVSLGNKADVSANDFLNYWDDDPDTAVVLLYTESFGNPRKFGRIARRVSRRKPIVAVKSGRGLPDDVAADALYQQAGVIRVDTVRQLFDVGRVLDGQPLPAGGRVAVVANADSPAVLALDAPAAPRGLDPAPAGADTRASAIAALAPPEATVGAAIDLTHRAGPRLYRRRAGDRAGRRRRRRRRGDLRPAHLEHGATTWPGPSTEAAAGAGKPVLAVTLGRDDGPLGARLARARLRLPGAGRRRSRPGGALRRLAAPGGGRGARRSPGIDLAAAAGRRGPRPRRAARRAPCCRWWRRPTCSPATASRWRRPAP